MSKVKVQRRRRRKPGDINAMRHVMWETLTVVEEEPLNTLPAEILGTANAVAALGGGRIRMCSRAGKLTARYRGLRKRCRGSDVSRLCNHLRRLEHSLRAAITKRMG